MIMFDYFDSLRSYAKARSGRWGHRIDLDVACSQAISDWYQWQQKPKTIEVAEKVREKEVERIWFAANQRCERFGLPAMLKKIVRYRMVDQLRQLPKGLVFESEIEGWQNLKDKRYDRQEEFEQRGRPNSSLEKMRQALDRCLRRLNALTREVVERKIFMNQSSSEVAEATGLTASAVDNRVSRFKQSVRREYNRLDGI